MKKRVLAIIFAAALVVTAMSGCKKVDDTQQEEEKAQDKRIQVIADNINVWKMDIAPYTDNPATSFEYCVADMDQNRRYELITAIDYGDDTIIKYYELNEDSTALMTLECVKDRDSHADIREIFGKDDGLCYKDSAGRYYYFYTDKQTVANEASGIPSKYESKVAVSIYNGKAYEETLATKSIVYEEGSTSATVSYKDAKGNEISEDAFAKAIENKVKGFTKVNVTFAWQGCTASNFDKEFSLTEKNFVKKLRNSLDGFKIG